MRKRSRLQVALYIPNLLCYARIVLAFVGVYYSTKAQPVTAIALWVVSAALDLFDGILARVLHQTSAFGILLDIVADNVLRTSVWVAVAASSSATSGLQMIAMAIIVLEWITMLATQLHAAQNNGEHWKQEREDDPWIVKVFFSNNFRNPLGVWGVMGLFTANLFLYGMHFPEVYSKIAGFDALLWMACVGRALSVVVELRFCLRYALFVLDKDAVEVESDPVSSAAKND